MSINDLILVGGGGHCKACIDVIESSGKFNIAGIIDLNEKVGQTILGYKIIGTDDELGEITKNYRNFLITLGQIESPTKRINLYNKLKKLDVDLVKIISPLAYVSQHSKIGKGTIIMHRAIINADAKIGNNCIINTGALIEHDSIIENHCHISTMAVINGNVKIGKNTFIGSGGVCAHSVEIPENSFIKANSIVKGIK